MHKYQKTFVCGKGIPVMIISKIDMSQTVYNKWICFKQTNGGIITWKIQANVLNFRKQMINKLSEHDHFLS